MGRVEMGIQDIWREEVGIGEFVGSVVKIMVGEWGLDGGYVVEGGGRGNRGGGVEGEMGGVGGSGKDGVDGKGGGEERWGEEGGGGDE